MQLSCEARQQVLAGKNQLEFRPIRMRHSQKWTKRAFRVAEFFKCLLLFSYMFIVLEGDLVRLNFIYRVSNKILLSVLNYFNLLDTLWFLSLFVHLHV
jgi:hypothetical protein